jgi:predicted transcriptional regulator
MKTIAEIAREIGVTKPAVRRYLSEDIRGKFAETVNGVIYISEQGEELIKAKFARNRAETTSESVPENNSETASALVSMLKTELEVKNKQIEELSATIRIQAESINMLNKNELAETIIDGRQKFIGGTDSKKSLFKRLFKG